MRFINEPVFVFRFYDLFLDAVYDP
jgi:hypothetical protein